MDDGFSTYKDHYELLLIDQLRHLSDNHKTKLIILE
jgi:hypothetical protein